VVLETQVTPADKNRYWRYLSDSSPAFDSVVFDEHRLADLQMIESTASAGRGNTFYLLVDNHPLVLRHYRRGGMVQKLTDRRYVYTGLSSTRAFREFDILNALTKNNLPVPEPYAVEVIRVGCFYEASIVTHRLPGETFAQRLKAESVGNSLWSSVGRTIAKFHSHGVFHADLNVHNIMVDENDAVSLIDFDRARFRTPPDIKSTGWCLENVDRLERSLVKVASGDSRKFERCVRGMHSSDAFEECTNIAR